MPLTLEIVTPEARVYSDTIDTVVLPTVQGEIGILPGHIPLLTRVAHGELIPDVVPADLHRLKSLRRALSEAVLPRFADDGPAHKQVEALFRGDEPLGHVCDVLAYALPLPVEMKQALLNEPHADIRAEIMTQALRVSAARADRKFPPGFSVN